MGGEGKVRWKGEGGEVRGGEGRDREEGKGVGLPRKNPGYGPDLSYKPSYS